MGKLTYAINQDNQVALAVYVTPSTSGGAAMRSASIRMTGQPEVDPAPPPSSATRTPLGHIRKATPFDMNLKWTRPS